MKETTTRTRKAPTLMMILMAGLLAATSAFGQGIRRQMYYDFTSVQTDPDLQVSVFAHDIDKISDPQNAYNDGGYVMGGYNHYYNTATGFGYDQSNLTKIDKCGNLIWTRDLSQATGGFQSRGLSVRQTQDKGYIVSGAVKTQPTGNWDILLYKTDEYGQLVWKKQYGGTLGDNFGESVREVYNPSTGMVDGYILTGAINIYTDNAFCNGTFNNATWIVIRTDLTGTMLWQQTIKPLPFGCTPPAVIPDYHHYAYGYDIEQVKDGSGVFTNKFVVAGTYKDPMLYNNYTPPFGCTACLGPLNQYGMLTNLTDNVTSGTINWSNTYPLPQRSGQLGNTTLRSVVQTDIGFVATGWTYFSPIDNDIYVVETDPGGTMISSRNYDAGVVERGLSVEATDDSYYVFGSKEIFTQPADAIATKIDRTTGVATWTQLFGGAGYDNAIRSLQEPGERFTTVGLTESFHPTSDYYFLNNIGDGSFTDCEECSVDEELDMYSKDGTQLGILYDHDFFAIKADPIFTTPPLQAAAGTECICDACEDVSITFQAGYGYLDDRGHSLRQTSDDGYILAGYTGGTDLSNPDIFMFKTDDMGVSTWSNIVFESTGTGNAYDERGFSVRQTPHDNGYAVAGDAISGSDRTAYLVKTSSAGVPAWSVIFGREATGTVYEDAALSVKQTDEDGNGVFTAKDGFIVAGFSDQPAPSPAFLMNGFIGKVRVNFGGINPTYQWGYTYGHDQNDYFTHIIQTDDDNDGLADDGYLAVGVTNSTFDPSHITPPTGMGGYNVFAVKIDVNGGVEWARIYGTDDDEIAYSVVQTDDDNDGMADDGFILVGATGDLTLTGTLENDPAAFGSSSDFYILKIGNDGAYEWASTIDQGTDDAAYSVVQANDFTYVITGEAPLANGNMQSILFKLSQCGELTWMWHYPEDPSVSYNVDHAREVTKTNDGGYALLGSTCTYASGTGTPQKGDFHLIKTDCLGDVCLSGSLNPSVTASATLEFDVYSIIQVGNGPDMMVGDPDYQALGTDYPICPEEEPKQVREPGEPIDLSWLFGRK